MNEENQNNMNRPHNYVPRKQPGMKYSDANNYSPSVSYNYAPNGQQNRGQNQNYQQPMHRRYRSQAVNYYDRIVKQNDILIKLLKEIRDRLPAPPNSFTNDKPRIHKHDHEYAGEGDMTMTEGQNGFSNHGQAVGDGETPEGVLPESDPEFPENTEKTVQE